MYKKVIYKIFLLPICCYALPYTNFTEKQKQDMLDVNRIPNKIAIRLWENYQQDAENMYPSEMYDNLVHHGYKTLLAAWNESIYNFYIQNKTLPRPPADLKPHYLRLRMYNSNKTYLENHDAFLTDTFFKKPHVRVGGDTYMVNDLSEVLWTAVLLQRRTILFTFANRSQEIYKKSKIYAVLKRMTIFYYPAHREADRFFDRYEKPRVNHLAEIIAPEDDMYLPAEDFFEMYANNYTNICPITENYICNTIFPLYEAEGAPCYCAVVEPFETDPRMFPYDDGCLTRAEEFEHPYLSLTISSLIPKHLAPTNTYGLLFAELLTVALVNATKLPGYFKPESLRVSPTVLFRLHCSSMMQEFTIQFAVTTRKFTIAPDGEEENDYLYLSPKRFWEEVEDQNTLQYLEDMGINIIRYGMAANLTDLDYPNSEAPIEYEIINHHESEEECRLPNTDLEFEIFHFVVFQNNCSELNLSFWKSLFFTWFLAFIFLFILSAGFAAYFQKYRWIISFGRFKRALQTQYVD